MIRRKILRAIDACRPGSDDLRLPELAKLAGRVETDPTVRELYRRSQALDARIARSMVRGAVPVGLAERILARAAADVASPVDVSADAPQPNEAELTQRSPRRENRRRWLWRAAAVAATLMATVTAYELWPQQVKLTREALVLGSGGWHEQLFARPDWKPLPGKRPLAEFTFAAAVRVGPRQWADVSADEFVGRKAVAYDVSYAGHQATLFVIPAEESVANSTPPTRPEASTGGLMVGCWQADGMVYVLVVEGDESLYRELLDLSEHPVA